MIEVGLWSAPMHSNARYADLQTRVATRKQMLISEAVEHKKNSCRAGAAESVDKIKARLSELAHIVKGGGATLELEAWISK
jgi:hypothetical protein